MLNLTQSLLSTVSLDLAQIAGIFLWIFVHCAIQLLEMTPK